MDIRHDYDSEAPGAETAMARTTRRAGWLVAMSLIVTLALTAANPASALEWPEWPEIDLGWEDSAAEDVTAKTIDILVLRPLGAVRVGVGAVLMAPAALFASPGGRENIDLAYEVLLEQPIEYAFRRELGDLEN